MKPISRSRQLAAKVLHTALTFVRDAGGEMRLADIRDKLRENLALDEWAQETIESNGLTRWETYLHFFSIDATKAGFLEKQRGLWRLTEQGMIALQLPPDPFLKKISDLYRDWQRKQLAESGKNIDRSETNEEIENDVPHDEQMRAIQKVANDSLAAEVLETIREKSPLFFERLVIQLLLKMGYGGFRHDAGLHLGRPGDGGIDGVIHEDILGLDPIFLQAKRYQGSIPDSDVRDFIGALAIRGARKGIFITTGRFAESSAENARTSQQPRIILIDGTRLAQLMISHNVGVSTAHTFQIKKIDSDFFSEE